MRRFLRHVYAVARRVPFSSPPLVPVPLSKFFRGREVPKAVELLERAGFVVVKRSIEVEIDGVRLAVTSGDKTYVLFNVSFVASFPTAKEFIDYVVRAMRNEARDPHLRPVRLDEVLSIYAVGDRGDGGDHR